MQLVDSRFEVERLVGSGGMGEVFRARDRVSGGLVALKVLYAAMNRDVDRFWREAQLLAEIGHPRIVKYVSHGVAHNNRPYIAMEWLEGEDLGERITRQGLTLHETIALVAGTAEGLAVLHDRGIVHRDIKPSNLFLVGGRPENVKVLDLGVARLLGATRPSTRSGVMVGTPGYMAPEQARGARELDARSDVFSLGCVLFECIAGKPAFAGENIAALLAKILLEEPPSLREEGVDVPPALDELVTRMLAKHASARPTNGHAVLRELERFADLQGAPAALHAGRRVDGLTGSERRLVSVVMASYGTEPAFGQPLSPSEFETMAATFDPRALVAGYGAEAEMLADGSMVVTLMGKGTATDQAAHAARCALALRSNLQGAHVALATGLATVTGRSCVGDVIERAASMLSRVRGEREGQSEETAQGHWPVFLDETTAGLLDTRFDVGGDERGLFIRGLRERDAKPRTLLGKPTPFVGREREISTLVGIFEECVAEPVARAVLVTGQAGAGKSRLVTEFLRRVHELGPVELWLTRGDAMTEGSPFSLLARLVRAGCGIIAGEPLVVRQQKLRARVARHLADSEVARVTEFVGELASVHFPDAQSVQLRAARQDSTLMGDQMRRAICDWVVAETREVPVVLVIEDLHWGDLPSVSFLDSALRAASDRQFMVLAVARGEVHELFPQLWEQRSLQEIRLGPLVRRAGERLVKDVLGETVNPEDVSRLLDRAAGNVFYLEELIRAFAETAPSRTSMRPPPLTPASGPAIGLSIPPPAPSTGRLPDERELARDEAAWSLPPTVLAMVQARLERLDPMARRLLRAASIFGEVFWRGSLMALTGGEHAAGEIDEWLSELNKRELVQRRDVSRFPVEREYQFRHALVRDAAYEMLTSEDRVLGHKLAAEWLEGAGEHEAMLLAEHFERGASLGRAASFYARAAAQALEGNDFVAARSRAERAMQAGVSGQELARLQLLLAEASRWGGDHEDALRHAEAAMRGFGDGHDGWFAAAAEAIAAEVVLGHSSAVSALATEVRARVGGEGTLDAERIVAISRIAVRILSTGLFAIADDLIGRVEREGREIVENDPAAKAASLAARVARAKWTGDIADAAKLAQDAVACFELVGDVRNAVDQRNLSGFCLLQLGAFQEAESVFRDATDAAERLGLPVVVNETKLHLAQLYARMQRKKEAIATIEEVIATFAAQGDRAGEGRARAYLVGAFHLAEEFAVATQEALKALPLLEHSPPYRASLLGLVAISRADKGDAQGAHEAGSEAMQILERLGGTVEGESIARLGHAEGLFAIGDVEGAKAAITVARDRLVARANRIEDPAWRKYFMNRLHEHRRILARAGEWLV